MIVPGGIFFRLFVVPVSEQAEAEGGEEDDLALAEAEDLVMGAVDQEVFTKEEMNLGDSWPHLVPRGIVADGPIEEEVDGDM